MSYWGTVVVARPHGLLVDQDGVAGFGHRHHWLRDLHDGWQLLETGGCEDPPDLVGACSAVVASTGHPVLAAYVSDSACAVVCAALPGQVGPLTHVWPVGRLCGAYRHQPRGMAEPVERGLGEVVEELAAWSVAGGLRPDVDWLRLVVGRDGDEACGQAVDLVFEVVQALGLTRIGRTFPWSLPAYDWPFSGVMFGLGPADQARVEARYRAAGVRAARPVQPWESLALDLEAELWASLYRPEVEVLALARRAAYVIAAYQADEGRAETSTAAVTLDETALHLPARLESRLASGVVPDWSEEFEARRQADERATEPGPQDTGART
jgi:hypothetical protein